MLATLVATLLAAVPTGNLVVNPGADAFDPLQGWTIEGNFGALPYSDDLGFPTPAQSASWGGGANFFTGGADNPASAATQRVDVSGAAREIDGGLVMLTLEAMIGGYEDQADAATVTATALDAGGAPLAATVLGTASAADRNNQTTLLPRSATASVPPGTRSILVRLASVRTGGDFNDGYIDKVGLSLALQRVPLAAMHVSGTVRVKRPGARGFEALTGTTELRIGSTVDVRRGAIDLTATNEVARFTGGVFVVRRPTELRLSGRTALRVQGPGTFRVAGRYSTTIAGGAAWSVREMRAGTVTRVTQNTAGVRDAVRHRTVTVRAGHRYVARPRT